VLVIDASLVVAWCVAASVTELPSLLGDQACAPPLMWSEARSALHERSWRGELEPEDAARASARLARVSVTPESHPRLGEETWRLADVLGWAKTYDAEYVALASLLKCRLVTLDARLHRGANWLGLVVGPAEL
jgi:predicted nucleic acid-binding protein